MATNEELADLLRELTEAHERTEAKLDRLLGLKGATRKRRLVLPAVSGPLPGTKKSRRAAAEALGLSATKR